MACTVYLIQLMLQPVLHLESKVAAALTQPPGHREFPRSPHNIHSQEPGSVRTSDPVHIAAILTSGLGGKSIPYSALEKAAAVALFLYRLYASPWRSALD